MHGVRTKFCHATDFYSNEKISREVLHHTFLVNSVTTKLLTIWRNNTYEKSARLMSL